MVCQRQNVTFCISLRCNILLYGSRLLIGLWHTKKSPQKKGSGQTELKTKQTKNKSKTTFYIVFNAKTTLITPETMQRRMTVSEMAMAMVMSMPRTESM